MKLRQLVKDIENISIKGAKEIDITGISSHSKTVAPGNLFIAKRGQKNDGNVFIREAIQSGAVAIVSDLYDPSLVEVTQIICLHVADLEALLAKRFFKDPSNDLFMIGVTGTSGKTTTTYAIKHLLDQLGNTTGLIGGVEYMVGRNVYQATRTTPEVVSVYRMLRDMVKSGCTSCVMEVTSHALDQGRVKGIDYDIAIFTNLSHEHLDYHRTMEAYAVTKNRLFRNLSEKARCLVNADDPWVHKITEGCPVKPLTYGIENDADIMADNISFSTSGSSFSVWYQEQKVDFFWPLVGRFNVLNALCVIGTALLHGIALDAIAPLMASFQGVPGRLERVVVDDVPLELMPAVFVDYSHKAEALKNVLQTLRECTRGRVITVFGCGGDRDREKRPMMAKIAEEFSDQVFITTDNPRNEDIDQIMKDIFSGFLMPDKHFLFYDRRDAISRAIALATPQDVVLIAGKGHECKQYFKYHTLDFNDCEVARECISEKLLKAGQGSLP